MTSALKLSTRLATVLVGVSLLGICACQSTGDVTSNWNMHPGSDQTWDPAKVTIGPRQQPPPKQQQHNIVLMSHEEPAAAVQPAGQVVCEPYTQTHPRIPLPMMSPEEYARAELIAQGGPTVAYRDEYLFDGGDRAKPVHYSATRRHGLDTEDTVVEYQDHTGKHKTKPSNRVAIYAPRFAAVRTVSVPSAGVGAMKMGSVDEARRISGLGIRTGTANHKGRRVPDAMRMRSRGSGIDADQKLTSGVHLTRAATQRKAVVPVANLAFIKSGMFQRTESAVLAKGITAAAVWSKRQFPVVVAMDHKTGEVSAKAKFNEYIGREPMLKKKGKLRVVKLADRKDAQPGDIITFTIRYDNLGERELKNMKIIDNLTPRLEFVEKSGDSDRAGRLVVEDNQEGSLVLKFELFDPLPGGKGGVVKFKARVK